MKRSLCMVGFGVLLAACGAEVGPGDVGVLDVKSTSSGLTGTFAHGGDTLAFQARQLSADRYDIVVELHGLTLSAVIDEARQVAAIDGFASNSGADTQIVEEDRALLRGLVAALPGRIDETKGTSAMLARVASHWSQTPDTVPLARSVAGSQDQGWTSLCSYYNKYVSASHDCSSYGWWAPNSTSYAHVGERGSSTYYLVNGVWTTTTQNHKAYLYERGNCYGNCGAGCPSGNQTLTQDCHNHDQCVRNGHALASLYCDDEFTSASDDEFFAPRCSGT